MNGKQARTTVGLVAGVALVVMLAGGWYLQRPITDRTLAILAVLLWATIQIDITAAVPFSIIPDPESGPKPEAKPTSESTPADEFASDDPRED